MSVYSYGNSTHVCVSVHRCVCLNESGELSVQGALAPKLERPLLLTPAEACWGAVSVLLMGRAGC